MSSVMGRRRSVVVLNCRRSYLTSSVPPLTVQSEICEDLTLVLVELAAGSVARAGQIDPDLAHELPAFRRLGHHRNAGGQKNGLLDIMGDEQQGALLAL